MVDIKSLLPDLRELVGELAEDLLARSTKDAKIDAGLRDAFAQIESGGRTAQAFEVWREDYLDQVAVAWVLACVFVRFLEDNQLIDECWLAGEGDQRKLAEDAHELFFRKHPHDTDREYFQHVFREVGKIPAAKDLFAEGKTPLWAVAPSGDAAMRLRKFWRDVEPASGQLLRLFQVEGGDTRFLGDLYQELSEKAKKKYALLQTPVFVEEFILDRTLTPALAEFGLAKVRLIDPTCGSGHFLLGAFARLFREWSKPDYTTGNERADAQKALDGVWGVDINPFAVAIARFRLIVAAVEACGIKRLKQAPGWTIHLASGDSLLFGSKPGFGGDRVPISQQGDLFDVPEIYATEDRVALKEILGQGYHVVVGNPPYIIVKDKVQNEAYRALYSTCHRQYSLGVPFTQRFWELATQQSEDGLSARAAGYIGMITANSYMKREFGKKLIEEFFPKIDLTHVIDTSGAYIPGHATPTVILFGRNQKPGGDSVRAVLGIKGEPATPEDASRGLVWLSILQHIDSAGTQDVFTSATDVPRTTFASHPWSIGGGGIADLKEALETQPLVLTAFVRSIGFFQDTHADEVFVQPSDFVQRYNLEDAFRWQVRGDEVRDWAASSDEMILFPYDDSLKQWATFPLSSKWSWLWCQRTWLWERSAFGGGTYRSTGRPWYDYHQFPKDRARTPLSIAFGEIATHNHFAFVRGSLVFNRTAPVIKLDRDSNENDHLGLLGLLNSSIACFWLKQVVFCKGLGGQGGGIKPEHWHRAYAFNGTQVGQLPVPEKQPVHLACKLDTLAQAFNAHLPQALLKSMVSDRRSFDATERDAAAIQGRMIALQEELDWYCYQLYGLVSDHCSYTSNDLPELTLGQRAFEIVMARKMAIGELRTTWFELHGSNPVTDLPPQWPDGYRELVERRIKLIETNKEIGLIERPEYKRRWNTESWEQQEQRALKNWLLDRLETPLYRKGTAKQPALTTTAQMADVASADAEFRQVAELYRGRPDFNLAALVAELVEAEAVPFLPVLRHKTPGMRKRTIWERSWDLQREQDDLEARRKVVREKLTAIESRIRKTFDGEQTKLKTREAKFRAECVKVRDEHASHLKLEPDASAYSIIETLRSERLKNDAGAAFRKLLDESKEISDLKESIQKRIIAAFRADAEYVKAEEAREAIPDDPEIAVPPKYASSDFLKSDFWRLRGKLDVPKERWICYPHCSTDGDPSLVVGWAGWNHLEQAAALVGYYDARKRDGWDPRRLTPLLAGLDQLLPWIHQWHPEVDKEYGETAGKSYQTLLAHDAHELGLTLDDIRAWTPPEKTRKTRKKKSQAEDEE